jgi:hypothetical protein
MKSARQGSEANHAVDEAPTRTTRTHQHHTTIDDLARMINEGFKSTATKEDVAALRTEMNEKFDSVETRLDHLDGRVGRIDSPRHNILYSGGELTRPCLIGISSTSNQGHTACRMRPSMCQSQDMQIRGVTPM